MDATRAALSRHAAALAAAAAGVGWLLAHAAPAILDPGHVAWLFEKDWADAYLGWAFVRHAPWALPLGANPGYPWPAGSTLAYSDSIPVLGVLLEPLSPALPEPFQYLGPWLALAFALQGFAGAKLAALATASRVQQALAGALFALSPVLVHRMLDPATGHPSLCAQFVVLAALWLALAPCADRRQALRRAGGGGALLLLASGIHPYLAVMALVLVVAAAVRAAWVDGVLRPAAAAALAAGAAATTALGFLAFGYLGTGATTAAGGFGWYSADLLALVNPMGWSRLLPTLPAGGGQYEGFGYLGAGVLGAGLAGIAGAAVRRRAPPWRRWRRVAPAGAACLLLAVVALSDRVTVAGHPVLHDGALDLVPGLAESFRSSGRFVWPLHALAVAGAVWACCAVLRDRPRLATAVLAAAVALQAVELRAPRPDRLGDAAWTPAGGPAWALARGAYRHLDLEPPYLLTGAGEVATEACGRLVRPWGEALHLIDLAARLHLTTNSGYLARLDEAAVARGCREARGRLARGDLAPDTIYAVPASAFPALRAAGATCGVLEGISACVRGDRTDAFAEALRGAAPGAGR